jgi:hypothetical protein
VISVLTMGSVACAAGSLAVTGRWWTRRRDELGRPRDFPVISVSLLAVLAVAVAVPVVRRHDEEDRLSRVASSLVGHPVRVHCQTFMQAMGDVGAELGFVRWDAGGEPEQQTLLKRDPCAALRHYYGGHQAHPDRDETVAVHVLTHESMHMRGQLGESAAECQAVQRDELTAQLLGATPEQARALARAYWLQVFPHMPDDYRSSDCAPGARRDEHLPSAPWAVS